MVAASRAVLSLLVAGFLLAGCAGKAGKGDDLVDLGDGSQVQLRSDTPQAGRGSISGVVVDEAIRPLAGVNVTVSGLAEPVVTDESGLFLVSDLQPGLYTLAATRMGYLPIQTSAEVVAGQTSTVRIVLAADLSPQPYHTTLAFDWYDQVSQGMVDLFLDLIGRGSGLPPVCDRCYFPFQSDMGVETFIVEATWQDTIPDPRGETEFFWALYDLSETADGNAAGYFSSPGRAEIPDNRFGNVTQFALGMTADQEWVAYQQTAQLFVTLWYLGPAPADWSFVKGDT